MKATSPIKAWHFLYRGSKLRNGQDAPPDGVTLTESLPLRICSHGLHASVRPWDALQHAPGPILCLVECRGTIIQQPDKLVCSERTIVARMDATDMLIYFARMQALSVIHLWDVPDVVLDYLMTGDDTIRTAAESAAWSVAWSVAWSAARSAARSAAWSAAESAAESAAWSAAWSARSAAWSAAESAAESAAWSAAWSAATDEFDALVYECFDGVLK